jgi:solute carrier family 6 amino acid transporter-like protein 5/7/9/14
MGQGDYAMSVTSNKSDEVKYEGDENEKRGNWSGRFDFILSAVGFAVGLGNVWRFPYIAYENGGASFLIPYVIMLATCGLPLFFMEMAFGQFASLGPISVWRAVPFFKGLGYAMVVISALVCIYYNMIIAYTLYYFFASLNIEVPWQYCKPGWAENHGCRDRFFTNETIQMNDWCSMVASQTVKDQMEGNTLTDEYANHTETCKPYMFKWCDHVANVTAFNASMEDSLSESVYSNYVATYCATYMKSKTPSEVYWEVEVLEMSEGIDVGGSEFSYKLSLCLLLAWIVIFVCLSKGIKSSGKVVYVTATFPYIVLIILLIRNVTLEGASVGINFYVNPNIDRLMDYKVWYRAAVQIFYSLGVAFGGLETMASYNKFRNNVYRDSLVVAILNCATSVFAGFVIFSVIGFMAVQSGKPVDEVVSSGPGLAFIAYPEGIAMMPASPLWAVLFFLMLFTLGLDSQFAMMETVISAIYDEFPWFQKGHRKIGLTLAICIILFLLGLPQCARNGIYIMNLFDWYSAGFSLVLVSLLEVVAISYIYGLKKFIGDIEMMIGKKNKLFWSYWVATWGFITPIIMLALFILFIVEYGPITYGDYVYPEWANGVGFAMVGVALVFIPVMAWVQYCKSHKVIETLSKVFMPTQQWGPALDKHRVGSDYPPLEYGEDGDIPEERNGKANEAFASDARF